MNCSAVPSPPLDALHFTEINKNLLCARNARRPFSHTHLLLTAILKESYCHSHVSEEPHSLCGAELWCRSGSEYWVGVTTKYPRDLGQVAHLFLCFLLLQMGMITQYVPHRVVVSSFTQSRICKAHDARHTQLNQYQTLYLCKLLLGNSSSYS